MMKKRAAILSIAFITGMTGCSLFTGNSEPGPEPFRIALSVSPFADAMFRWGYSYEDSIGNKAENNKELQQLFVAHGATEVYVRIGTARKRHSLEFADHSLETAIEKAELAKELDLFLNPELGLFQFYGDVTGQPAPDFSEYPEIDVPGPWETLSMEEMVAVLEQYGEFVAQKLLDTGVKIRVWNLGNEIDFGTAGVAVSPLPGAMESEMGSNWYREPSNIQPEIGNKSVFDMLTEPNSARIKWLEQYLWPYQAKLLSAVMRGVQKVDSQAKFSSHISTSTDPEFGLAFWQAMIKGGYAPDIIGFSFYPSASPRPESRLEAFKETVKLVNMTTGLPVFVCEYAYPAYPENYTPRGVYKDWNNQEPGYITDISGQTALLSDLTGWGVENGICGIRPWAPDLLEFSWGEFSFFEVEGLTAKAKPVIDAIKEGLAKQP